VCFAIWNIRRVEDFGAFKPFEESVKSLVGQYLRLKKGGK
jgi:hypothetical protein